MCLVRGWAAISFPWSTRASFGCGCERPTELISLVPSVMRKQALNLIEQEVGKENVDLTLGYVGMIHSNFPVNAVYQWSRGPEEAILYVDLNDRWRHSTSSR